MQNTFFELCALCSFDPPLLPLHLVAGVKICGHCLCCLVPPPWNKIFLSLQQACVCYSDQQCTSKTLHFISDCHKLDLENSKQVDDHGVNISKIFFSHASGGVHCCHCGQKDKRCSVIWRKIVHCWRVVDGLSWAWAFNLSLASTVGVHHFGASPPLDTHYCQEPLTVQG